MRSALARLIAEFRLGARFRATPASASPSTSCRSFWPSLNLAYTSSTSARNATMPGSSLA